MDEEVEVYKDKGHFLKAFREQYADKYLPEDFGEVKKQKVLELTSPPQIKTMMFASIPMICKGEKCVFADTCPLLKANVAPIDKPCGIELRMASQFVADYMEQLQIEEDNFVEVSMIRDLVDQEIQYLRTSKFLAKESFIQENFIGIDPSGKPILAKQLHLAVDMQDRIHKRRQTLFKALLASREAKAKAGGGQLDSAQVISGLLSEISEISKTKERKKMISLGLLEKADEEFIEAEIVDD